MPTLAGKPLVYSPSRPRHLDYARAGQSTQLYTPRHARTCCKKVCSPGRIAPTFGTQSFVSHVARQRRRGLSSCPSFESASTSSTSGELSGPWGRCGTLSDVQHAWRKPTSSLCWKENCCRHLLDSGDPIKHIFPHFTLASPAHRDSTRANGRITASQRWKRGSRLLSASEACLRLCLGINQVNCACAFGGRRSSSRLRCSDGSEEHTPSWCLRCKCVAYLLFGCRFMRANQSHTMRSWVLAVTLFH